MRLFARALNPIGILVEPSFDECGRGDIFWQHRMPPHRTAHREKTRARVPTAITKKYGHTGEFSSQLLLAIILVCIFSLSGRAGLGSPPPPNFLFQYRLSESHLETAYDHVKIKAKQTRYDEDGTLQFVEEVEFLRNNDLVRVESKILRSNLANLPVGTIRYIGGSGDQHFDVSRRADAHWYKFNAFGPIAQPTVEYRLRCLPLFAAYCASGFRVIDQLEEPNVRLVSQNITTLGQNKVIEVDLLVTNDKQGEKINRFFFFPDSWALAGWELPMQGTRTPTTVISRALEGRVDYEPGSDPPKIKSVDCWIEFQSNPQMKHDERNVEVQSIEFVKVPPADFTLQALGIREPGSPNTMQRTWLWIMSALLLAALGALLAILARRHILR